jgi:hypothetical protein
MHSLDGAFQVECQKLPEPLVTERAPAYPLDYIQIRCLVDSNHARPAVEQGDIPANHYLVGERALMGMSNQVEQLGPARKLAVQNLHACLVMPLVPSFSRKSPRSAGAIPQFAGMKINAGCDAAPVKVVDNHSLILRHSKNRIGCFEFPPFIATAHHPYRRKGAICKVCNLPVGDEPWLHQERPPP